MIVRGTYGPLLSGEDYMERLDRPVHVTTVDHYTFRTRKATK